VVIELLLRNQQESGNLSPQRQSGDRRLTPQRLFLHQKDAANPLPSLHEQTGSLPYAARHQHVETLQIAQYQRQVLHQVFLSGLVDDQAGLLLGVGLRVVRTHLLPLLALKEIPRSECIDAGTFPKSAPPSGLRGVCIGISPESTDAYGMSAYSHQRHINLKDIVFCDLRHVAPFQAPAFDCGIGLFPPFPYL
jgi:hypothetical protein